MAPKKRGAAQRQHASQRADCKAEKALAKANADSAKLAKSKDHVIDVYKQKAEMLGNELLSNASVGRRVITDSLASLGSMGTNELINLGMRALAEWSKETEGEKGWFYRNVAYTQSAAGLIGTVAYITDALLQKAKEDAAAEKVKQGAIDKPYMPSDLRLGFSKWALMLSNLGLSNFVRALRYSYAENIDERQIKSETIAQQGDQIKAAQAEKEAQAKALKDAQAEVARLTKELQQARTGQGPR